MPASETVILLSLAVFLAVAAAILGYVRGYRSGVREERASMIATYGLPVGDGVTDDTAAMQRLVYGARP